MSQILLVDDDDEIRSIISQFLETKGHGVHTVANSNNALKLLEKLRPTAMITDLIMPGEGGLALIRNAREAYPNMKIIAISGGGRNGPEDYLECAKAYGADHVFPKPIDFQTLISLID